MFRFLAQRGLKKFSQQYDYDVSYFRYTLDASISSFYRFSLLRLMSTNRGPVPKAPWACASIRASLGEDCGPCVQLTCRMAEEVGVTQEVIQRVLKQQYDLLPDDVALACRYADLTVAKAPAANDLRPLIVERWGDEGLVCLAMGVSTVRVYPMYKQALGYGKACERINVGDNDVAPKGIALGAALS